MRKNKMMRAASALLVAVLLTTSTISGTFAKYVTTASGSDTARVAKWGVQVDMTAFADSTTDLFTDTYARDSATGIANTVVATEDVVAPGTKHEGIVAFTLTGTPEVAVHVDFEVTNSAKDDEPVDVVLPEGNYTDWTQAPYTGTFAVAAPGYYPVVFTLVDTADETTPLAQGTLADIKTFLEGKNNDYDANTSLETILGGTSGEYKLSWAWEYTNAALGEISNNDRADTLLGNIAADKTTYGVVGASTTIDFAIEITVTQID